MADDNKTPTVDKAEPKKVEVSETVLKDILAKMEGYQTEITALKDAQKEWEQTASQDQIMKIEKMRAAGKLVKSIRVSFYDNKMVVGWKSTADDVYIDNTGKEVAVQKTMLSFSDGKDVEVAQLDFARRKLSREFEVIKEGRDRDGNMIYTIITDGGKEVEVDGRYIN